MCPKVLKVKISKPLITSGEPYITLKSSHYVLPSLRAFLAFPFSFPSVSPTESLTPPSLLSRRGGMNAFLGEVRCHLGGFIYGCGGTVAARGEKGGSHCSFLGTRIFLSSEWAGACTPCLSSPSTQQESCRGLLSEATRRFN